MFGLQVLTELLDEISFHLPLFLKVSDMQLRVVLLLVLLILRFTNSCPDGVKVSRTATTARRATRF